MPYENYRFEIKPLLYHYNSLEPYIDAKTMYIHYHVNLQTYVDNLNGILSNYPSLQDWSLEQLVTNYNQLPFEIQSPVKNNAGGVYNHNLFFSLMTPNLGVTPTGNLKYKLLEEFGSYSNFFSQFKISALERFGSGYVWLVANDNKELSIISTANQDTPLPMNLYPILNADVWEHAYYLKHINRRVDYLNDWFNIVNWDMAEELFNNIK